MDLESELGESSDVDTAASLTRAELLARNKATQTRAAPLRSGKGITRGLIALVVLAVVLAAVAYVNAHLSAPPARSSLSLATKLDPTETIPGSIQSLSWPTTGEAAVSVPAVGFEANSPASSVVPIASLTKIMTAYVILTDHPLGAGQDGPSVTITPADVTAYDTDVGLDESSVVVAAGEKLTERQLLEGLLVHSANNFADILATWDAGSLPSFVAKMNATAQHLSMNSTHYADASGFSSLSVSTPLDVLKVAAAALSIPTFAQTVKMSSVSLPVSGVVGTYTPMLGLPGVVGVKSGYTIPAGGCDVLALSRQINGADVVALAAVTGQTGVGVLNQAGGSALALATHAVDAVTTDPVVQPGMRVATVSFGGKTVEVVTSQSASLYVAPGSDVEENLKLLPAPRSGSRAGVPVGEMTVSCGTQRRVVVVHTDGNLPAEPLIQRLL